METVKIPGLPLEPTRVALGTWAIGGWMWGGTDQDRSIATIHSALRHGVNIIDTAPVYGNGTSEDIVGQAVQSWGRDKVVLATKAGLEFRENDSPVRKTTQDRLFWEIEESLNRLRTDVIDIYQVHWPDPLTPARETARAMKSLYDQGLIRAIGVSNYSVEQIKEFRDHAPLHTCQPPYNIFERGIEDDVLPYCNEHGIVLLTYGALCRGLLTGKMTQDTEFPGDDLRNADPKFEEPRYSRYLKAVERLQRLAAGHNKHIINLAVRWILDQGVDIALWGARKPSQTEAMPKTFGWSLSDEDKERVERILEEAVGEPIGPTFMAPPDREEEVA